MEWKVPNGRAPDKVNARRIRLKKDRIIFECFPSGGGQSLASRSSGASILKSIVPVPLEILQKPLTISPWDVKPNWSASMHRFVGIE